MGKPENSLLSRILIQFCLPIIIGMSAGILLLWGFPQLNTIWAPFIAFNHDLSSPLYKQKIILTYFSYAIVGAVAGRLSGLGFDTKYDAIKSGIISAECAGLTYFFGNEYFRAIDSLRHGFSYTHDPFYLKLFLHNLSWLGFGGLIALLTTMIIAVIFGIIGTYLLFVWDHRKIPVSPSRSGIVWNFYKMILPCLFAGGLVIVLIIVPVAFVHEEIKTGAIQRYSYSCCGLEGLLYIQRTGTDSITITQTSGGAYISWAPRDTNLYYDIYVNGKEMSNLSIIRAQGLPDTINPSEGLFYGKGMSVTLKGPDISSDCKIIVQKKGFTASEYPQDKELIQTI